MISLMLAVMLQAAPAQFVWPKPELVEEVDIAEVIRADGVPVRLHLIRSKRSVEQLLAFYAQAFVEAGFYVAKVQQRRLAEPHVTGLDWRTLISYSAILTANDDGTTTVMMGEAALGKKKTAAKIADFAPLYPQAREVTRVEQEGVRVLSFVAPRATIEQVQKFYGEKLSAAGFRRSDDEANRFEKQTEQVTLMLTSAAEATSVVLLQQSRSAPLAR